MVEEETLREKRDYNWIWNIPVQSQTKPCRSETRPPCLFHTKMVKKKKEEDFSSSSKAKGNRDIMCPDMEKRASGT